MRYAVNLNLYCQTNANANAVRNFVESHISGPGRELSEPATVIDWHRGIKLVNAYVFCPDQADAQSLYDGVIDAWTSGAQAARILSGSWVKLVESHEDEGGADVLLAIEFKP